MQKRAIRPTARATIQGGDRYPNLSGIVSFYQKPQGVLVTAQINGLPQDNSTGFFGFHIHEGTNCGGTDFSETGAHFNPKKTEHPSHAGDLPPLLSDGGGAYMTVFTNRFSVRDILGRTVVIHDGPDDFVSQPAGNSGNKIACGIIRPV